ncbi:Rieske 2Fe-2S domain-containing protein [Novosphingobium sp. PY1]|uniref:Rieske 2Fe-2S domain-containing protein n=1 Tax=Novosphingobium sp. PY1 TaxID=1882221 RepID=UPI000BE77778|nr:Rieske 2Fe-2S domain-containing protein [Novosphingobium sp. PY1]BBA72027.1 putative Rieske oxygenase [Novosphingobium sp. PY1]BBA74032.1 putative phthalate dioxygenase [Novosphingobium sp. PY1]GFM31269.1 putative phthalate dioxygenase [Novosphingobium sp. PY1]
MTPEQNDILCRVEGDAPMGKLMRQHWIPACMIEEVAEPDGTPLRVRLLGENMVVFRDTEGRLGALDEHCPHRRASLAFGRNEECGLRCLYHGWKFDVEGNAVDMSSEPADAKLRSTMKTKAYPVVESGGFVWVWMGDPANVLPFDPPNWSVAPDDKIAIMKIHGECNWAQILEGAIDSSHSSSLHSTNMPTATNVSGSTATETAWLRPSADKAPRIEVEKTSFGFRYAAIRKPIVDADKQDYVRSTLFVAPFTVHIPSNNQYHLSQLLIPIDDVNTMFYWIAWHPTKGISQDGWRKFCGAEVGKDVEPITFRKIRNLENKYLQDRAAMKAGDFTGIYGIPCQDMAMWESMGPLADRSEDRLGSSDKAIFTFRTVMYRAAQAVAKGEPAIGTTEPHVPQVKLMSFEGMVPKGEDWKERNISDEERALRTESGGTAQDEEQEVVA